MSLQGLESLAGARNPPAYTQGTAVGIMSGNVQVPACKIVFTDIRDAYYALPGTIKTTTVP